MARFCPHCGAEVREAAKFCGGCGNQMRQRKAISPHGGPRPDPRADFVVPVSPVAPETAAPPPQYWESYDYPSPRPDATPRYEGWNDGYRPTDASRPLPPLFMGEGPSSPDSSSSPVSLTERESSRERAREIARNFSLWAAGIVLFPIPFADLVLLMPVQTAMVISIGKAYGVKDPPEKMLAHIAAACGASVFGQITTMFVSSFIPIIGKIVTAPFVYGWTYGLGEVAMRYFETQGEVNKDEMKQIFKQASKQATRAFKPADVSQARQNFDHLRDHLSEEDYRKLRDRFGNT